MAEDMGPEAVRGVTRVKGIRPTGFEDDVEDLVSHATAKISNIINDIGERAAITLQQAVKLSAHRRLSQMIDILYAFLPRCGSEIEKQFLIAMVAESEVEHMLCLYDPEDWSHDPDKLIQEEIEQYLDSMIGPIGPDLATLRTQVHIGKYRADFVVYGLCANHPDPRKWLRVPVVVECDGHEFHEKTKHQAKHDKARDRYLKSQGFHILRFTGSEIYNDPAKCVREVISYISRLQTRHHFGKTGGFGQ